ncbi:MAG: hypothetical protein WBL40_16040 [Terrimicrobiaceae bacterium]
MKPKPKLKRVAPVVSTASSLAEKPPITFRVNIITDIDPARPFASDHGRMFVHAGQPSPYRSIEQVPERLRPFIGLPEPPQDLSHLEAEWHALDESIGAVSESVQEEIERKQSEAIAAAAAIDEVESASASREDEFFADELKRHDAEVAKFYQEHPQP